MKILAVGERFNHDKDWRPVTGEQHGLDLRLRLGFYPKSGPELMKKLGVRWTDGINLLWPSKSCGSWDAGEAMRVADSLFLNILNLTQFLRIHYERLMERTSR